MNKEIPVVKIHHPNHPDKSMIINECDFDPDKHELWDKPKQADDGEKENPEAKQVETSNDNEVGKKKKRSRRKK